MDIAGDSKKVNGVEDDALLGRSYVFLMLIVFLALGVALKFSPLTVFLFILPYIILGLLVIGLYKKLTVLKMDIQEIKKTLDRLEKNGE